MKNNQKNTSLLRRILTVSVVLCFIFFLLVFVQQYTQYKRVEDRLSAAYSTNYQQSSGTYKLISTFGEADNFFRLYTVDYSESAYHAYKEKLEALRLSIDSISKIPMEDNPMAELGADLEISRNYATEFANLRKNIDALVFYAADSLVELRSMSSANQNRRIVQHNADSIVNKILRDTIVVSEVQDTVVRKKGGLIQRIFNTKNDTLVNTNQYETLSNKQIDVVHKNIEYYLQANERIFHRNLTDLRFVMLQMRNKERALVTANYTLLTGLKSGLDQLKELEINAIRKSEAQDFALYKENFNEFGMQLIAAVVIMLLMMIFIIYYYYKTSSFEKKLYLEKEYASKIAEEKTNILANVSHEVRAPLNSVKGIIDLLKKNNNVQAIDREIIQTVDKDITVINGTLNDILNLSKLEEEQLDIKMEYFSPYQLMDEIIALHKYPAKSKKLKFTYHNKIDASVRILSNSFRVRQVISNIISNAIKYTSVGKVLVEAELTQIDGYSHFVVNVHDTGIGIVPEKRDQVFRKYYVADNINRSSGFGLGLYISKLLSEQIGGDITFTSKFAQGSTFTFDLPIDKTHLRRDDLKNLTVDDIPHDLEILVIEDSRISLFFVQQLFKGKKNVHLFHSSAQAWNYIQTSKVDVVITDLIMPEMDGWQLLQHIKSSPETAHIRTYVATAEPMLLESSNEYEYHFDGSVAKPIQEHDIVKAILGQ